MYSIIYICACTLVTIFHVDFVSKFATYVKKTPCNLMNLALFGRPKEYFEQFLKLKNMFKTL